MVKWDCYIQEQRWPGSSNVFSLPEKVAPVSLAVSGFRFPEHFQSNNGEHFIVRPLKMAKIKAFDSSPCSLLSTGIGIVELWYGLLKNTQNKCLTFSCSLPYLFIYL